MVSFEIQLSFPDQLLGPAGKVSKSVSNKPARECNGYHGKSIKIGVVEDLALNSVNEEKKRKKRFHGISFNTSTFITVSNKPARERNGYHGIKK